MMYQQYIRFCKVIYFQLFIISGNIQLNENDAKGFLDREKRGITEECNEGCNSEEYEEFEENHHDTWLRYIN